MTNNLSNFSNLKRLAKYQYNDDDECYQLVENFIVDLNINPIQSIRDEFIRLNKNNNFAFSLIGIHDIPKNRFYTKTRICDRKDTHFISKK
nr:MAG TPA: hypothetical protein [Caudoviricetes sp.]